VLTRRFCRSTGGVSLALLIVGGERTRKTEVGMRCLLTHVRAAIVFLIVGVFAFIVSAKGRQSRPLVICFMITMICFFIVALVQVTQKTENCVILCAHTFFAS
jgi:uncharacterized protein with PQ loop repeat